MEQHVQRLKTHAGNQKFEPWQQAEFHRLLGDTHLERDDFASAQSAFLKSIGLNRKEPKTWQSYGRFNADLF
jgi:hypothetical protein